MIKNWLKMFSYRALICFFILISMHVGDTLRCACEKDSRTCVSIQITQADYKTAQQICIENGGKLLTPSSKTINSLLFRKTGDFWIGITDKCLNSRGSGEESVALDRGKWDEACSSQCMAVSSNGKITKRACENQTDGFLCEGIQWETCWKEKASEVQILNNQDCGLAPCEHQCEEVPGGHMCSCLPRFRPSRKKREGCEYACNSITCPRLCDSCECPDGFIKDDAQCTDLDECSSNHNNCMQKCRNTIGSYKCSCHEGFLLVNRSKCVPYIYPTPLALLTAPVNYTFSHAAFASPTEYISLTVFIILFIFALLGLLYYLKKRKPDVHLKDSSPPDDASIQEMQLQV